MNRQDIEKKVTDILVDKLGIGPKDEIEPYNEF